MLRLLAMVFIAAVHGIAVAGTAFALGDPGPRYDGRLTPNPLSHLDVLGTRVLPQRDSAVAAALRPEILGFSDARMISPSH